MAKGAPRQNSSSLMKALEGLTDGLYGMFSKRIELARHEIIQDVQQFGIFIGILVFCGVIVLIGYGLLNFALVLAAGALWSGAWVMPGAAGALAVLNVLVALSLAWYSVGRLQEVKEMVLKAQRREIQRDKRWVKQLVASAQTPLLTAPTTPATAEPQPTTPEEAAAQPAVAVQTKEA